MKSMPARLEVREGLGACPLCADELLVQEYRCRGCGTVLRGSFRRCEVCALPDELLHFVNVFLEAEGNFRSVERGLGISCPTVKARLACVNGRLADARLRADADPPEDEEIDPPARSARLALLHDVRSGRIGVDDAPRQL